MQDKYIFEYINENEFKKLERSLKKYNMLAYKKLYFSFYPDLKEGKVVGTKISTDEEGYDIYEAKLPTDALFSKVHGVIKLHYKINQEIKKLFIMTLTPEKILTEGHQSELVTYKGVMVSSKDKEKDIFKINLLNMIQK